MIKEGDKVICINNVYEEQGLLAEIPCEIGDIIEVSFVNHEHMMVYILDVWDFNINTFLKYFITLSEWREQQMKSILDG
jgi:hypothetical protein